MADYAIHDTTLIGISNVIRKKEGSSALIDPAEYAERVNLMGMLEEKTASGSIVTFSDGADDVPTKSLVVTIPPTLTGVSSVTETQTGRNLIPFAVDYPNFTQTKNDMTISVLANGKVKFNGTTTASTDFTFYSASTQSEPHLFVKNGTYTFSNIGSASVKMVVSGGSNNGFPYREITNSYYTGSVTDETKPFNYIIFRIASGVTLSDVVIEPMLEYGSTAHDYEPYQTPTTYTASLGRTIYGGTADIVKGTGTDENGNDFTFTGQEINTRLGYNAFWSDSGDTEVTYRSSGTLTPIVPTLISKNITANGTYTASDDGADGYSEVVVNVPSIQSIAVHSGKLNIKNGTITEDADYCYTDEIECPNGWMRMDFGETAYGDFIGMELLNNGTHTNYWVANDRFRSIDLSSYYSATKTIRLAFRKTYADVIVFIDYSHSKLYSSFTMLVMQEESASLLSMGGGNSGSTEESEEVSEYSDNEEQGEKI